MLLFHGIILGILRKKEKDIPREMWRWSFLLVGWVMTMIPGITPARAGDLKDQELSTLVKNAYVYSFPVYEMYRIRYRRVFNPNNPVHVGLNQFEHARKLGDHTFREVTAPNNDTLYSNAWLEDCAPPRLTGLPRKDRG